MSSPFQLYNYFNIGIIEDKLDNCRTNFQELLRKGNLEVHVVDEIELSSVCATADLEYNPSQRKFLLYEPLSNPNITVFFSNLVDGWYTAVYNYTRLFHKNAFLLSFTVHTGQASPAYFFRYFNNNGGEVEERVVHLIKEDRWAFYESGKPIDIEDTANYSKRFKSERLNNEVILTYLKKAGYDLTQEVFYKSNKEAYICQYT
jgi:hypothetical protein